MTDKHENWTRDFAISTADDKEKLPIIDEHGYYAIFEFPEEEEQTLLHLTAKSVCPTIKLSKRELNFGECPMNERRDILVDIENLSEDLAIDGIFQKVKNNIFKINKAS